MPHAHAPRPQSPYVTVLFGDGAHSFQLSAGTTLTQLTDRIDALGAQHDGALISIDIEFKVPRARSLAHSLPRHPATH